jgi:hypothetical protein
MGRPGGSEKVFFGRLRDFQSLPVSFPGSIEAAAEQGRRVGMADPGD